MDLGDLLRTIDEDTNIIVCNFPWSYLHILYEGKNNGDIETITYGDTNIWVEYFETAEVTWVWLEKNSICISVDIDKISLDTDDGDFVTLDFYNIDKGLATQEEMDVYDSIFKGWKKIRTL